jgi:hypothetical protein
MSGPETILSRTDTAPLIRSGDLLGFVRSLMEKNYEAVGFLPMPRLEEYAERGQILTTTENGDLCGYLVWGNRWPRLRVYQACVCYDARRREHGLAMVRDLLRIATESNCDMVSLWCADDLEANSFWQTAGFRFGGQRSGGHKRGRKHNLWVITLETRQLLLPNEQAER